MSAEPISRPNARQNRLYSYELPLDERKSTSIMPFADCTPRKGVAIKDQVVILNFAPENSLYPDDVIALMRDMLVVLNDRRHHDRNDEAINHLKQAIYAMDKRSVEIHNYSRSIEEQNVKVPY